MSFTNLQSLTNVINHVIRRDAFCCLCFSTQNKVAIKPLTLDIDTKEHCFVDILHNLLGAHMREYLLEFGYLCDKCVEEAIQTYSFIQKSHQNASMLTKALETLNQSVDLKLQDSHNKSLFIKLNTDDFTCQYVLDTASHTNPSIAIKHFQALSSPHVNIKRPIKKIRNKKSYIDKNINPKDILLDPSDRSVLKCKECFKTFSRMYRLAVHYEQCHAPKVYKCHHCSRAYGSTKFLDYHLRVSHCNVSCKECGKEFHNKATLRHHEMGHKVKIVCPECGRVYKSKITYLNHIELKICEQPNRASVATGKYQCDYCKKRYSQKTTLRAHIKCQHSNNTMHVCEWCGKKLISQSSLKAHIVKHTGEKNFTCDICKEKFVTRESLLYHTRRHTGETPYKCPLCPRSFLSSSRRAYHVRKQHEGGTLECDVCQSKFTTKLYLEKHKKLHLEPETSAADNIVKLGIGAKQDAKVTYF